MNTSLCLSHLLNQDIFKCKSISPCYFNHNPPKLSVQGVGSHRQRNIVST